MSKGFKISNGDLSVGAGRSFEVVSGRDKLLRDLKLWILEHIGTDPSTPTFGSTLDGGIINGKPVPSFIGQTMSQDAVNAIRADVLTVVTSYQQQQLQKMQAEIAQLGGHTTLSNDEIIETIDNVAVAVTQDIIIVSVTITTLDDQTSTLTLPVNAT